MPWWLTVTDPQQFRPYPVGAFADFALAEQMKAVWEREHPDWSISEPFEAPYSYPESLPRPIMTLTRSDGVYEIWSDGAEYRIGDIE